MTPSKKKISFLALAPALMLLLVLIINSAYLSYKYSQFYFYGDFAALINCSDDCDSVMMSEYALLFGIPVPIYGLSFFVALTVLFIGLFFTNIAKKLMRFLFDFSLLLGCIAASVFLYVLYFELEMFCKFCTLSHACTGLLTIYYFIFLRKNL